MGRTTDIDSQALIILTKLKSLVSESIHRRAIKE